MKTLIFWGDSLLAHASKSHVLFLEEKLLNNYDVYNCAVGGWDSRDILKKTPYITKLKPDVILISIGTNDASPWKQVLLNEFIDNLNTVIGLFNESRIVFFPPMPIDESKQQPDKQRTNVLQKQYYDAVVQLCLENDIEYVKSWAVFSELLERNKEYLVEDGVHLNDLAYETLFSKVAEILI